MKHENTHTEMQVSEQSRIVVGFVLVFNATSTIFQLYRDGQFYWRRKPEYPEKTTDLSQVNDKLYHTLRQHCIAIFGYFLKVRDAGVV
jgi:hypothetical protein